jgi:hypothetical protein
MSAYVLDVPSINAGPYKCQDLFWTLFVSWLMTLFGRYECQEPQKPHPHLIVSDEMLCKQCSGAERPKPLRVTAN